jgi:hypothetical protein
MNKQLSTFKFNILNVNFKLGKNIYFDITNMLAKRNSFNMSERERVRENYKQRARRKLKEKHLVDFSIEIDFILLSICCLIALFN